MRKTVCVIVWRHEPGSREIELLIEAPYMGQSHFVEVDSELFLEPVVTAARRILIQRTGLVALEVRQIWADESDQTDKKFAVMVDKYEGITNSTLLARWVPVSEVKPMLKNHKWHKGPYVAACRALAANVR